jgi:hypothetical protein
MEKYHVLVTGTQEQNTPLFFPFFFQNYEQIVSYPSAIIFNLIVRL